MVLQIDKTSCLKVAHALQLDTGYGVVMGMGGVLLTLGEQRLQRFVSAQRVGIGLAAAAVLAVLGMSAHCGWIVSKNLGKSAE